MAPCCAPVSRHVRSAHLPAGMHTLHDDARVDHHRHTPMHEAVALLSQRTARLLTRLVLRRRAHDRWLVGAVLCTCIAIRRREQRATSRCDATTCASRKLPALGAGSCNVVPTKGSGGGVQIVTAACGSRYDLGGHRMIACKKCMHALVPSATHDSERTRLQAKAVPYKAYFFTVTVGPLDVPVGSRDLQDYTPSPFSSSSSFDTTAQHQQQHVQHPAWSTLGLFLLMTLARRRSCPCRRTSARLP
jgi:hypothetical protein